MPELRAMRPPEEEPADFDAFWAATFEEAGSVALDWTIRRSADWDSTEVEVYDVEYAGLLGNRIGGWLTKPRGEPVERGAVCTHGYGGRAAPELVLPMKNAAVIFPVCTGQPERSLHPGIPADPFRHVVHGIESRETYVHRFCAADVWRAASVLLQAVPEAARSLNYLGGSFGGGIGALALPWDARFHRAHLGVPSFGNHPVRLRLPCAGSGEAVRQLAGKCPEIRGVLAYFDAATAARRIRIPTHVAAARFDPAVPPAGQFSVYAALAGARELFELTAGHFSCPETSRQDRQLFTELESFFAA